MILDLPRLILIGPLVIDIRYHTYCRKDATASDIAHPQEQQSLLGCPDFALRFTRDGFGRVSTWFANRQHRIRCTSFYTCKIRQLDGSVTVEAITLNFNGFLYVKSPKAINYLTIKSATIMWNLPMEINKVKIIRYGCISYSRSRSK